MPKEIALQSIEQRISREHAKKKQQHRRDSRLSGRLGSRFSDRFRGNIRKALAKSPVKTQHSLLQLRILPRSCTESKQWIKKKKKGLVNYYVPS